MSVDTQIIQTHFYKTIVLTLVCMDADAGCDGIYLNCSANDGLLDLFSLPGYSYGPISGAYLHGTCFNKKFITTSNQFNASGTVVSCDSSVTDCYLACLKSNSCAEFSV